MQGEVRITVIATGFSGESPSRPTSNKVVINTPAPSPAPTPEPPKPAGLDIPDFLQRRRPFDR
jgi:cell division protein FtsZ